MIFSPIPLLLAAHAAAVPVHTSASAGAPISGHCFEARTASVFAGACHYGGEATTAGREAIVVWRFEAGAHAGVDLSGISAAAAIAADQNLADASAARRSVVYLPESSTEAARRAVLDLLSTRFGAVVGRVLEVRTVPLEVVVDGDRYRARAGERFAIEGEALPDRACCKMPVNVWYRPLVALERPIVGHNSVASLSEERLGPAWTRFDENTGFLGTFALPPVEAALE